MSIFPIKLSSLFKFSSVMESLALSFPMAINGRLLFLFPSDKFDFVEIWLERRSCPFDASDIALSRSVWNFPLMGHVRPLVRLVVLVSHCGGSCDSRRVDDDSSLSEWSDLERLNFFIELGTSLQQAGCFVCEDRLLHSGDSCSTYLGFLTEVSRNSNTHSFWPMFLSPKNVK